MATHKFLTPRLAGAAAIAYMGFSPTSAVGFILLFIVAFFVQWLENAGLRTLNVVAIDFTTDRDKKEFDEAQEAGLDPVFVASLTTEQRLAKSKDFRAKFRKFASFGFMRKP